jgi:hypothetical protein
MRGRILLGCVLLALVAGCETPRAQIKPPPLVDDYSGPPLSDARYDRPPDYPKEFLNKSLQPREVATMNPNQQGVGPAGGPGGGARFGAAQ